VYTRYNSPLKTVSNWGKKKSRARLSLEILSSSITRFSYGANLSVNQSGSQMTQSNVAAALTSAFLHSGRQSCIICTKLQKTAVTCITYMLSTRSRDTILQTTWCTECTLQTNITDLYSGSQTVSPARLCSRMLWRMTRSSFRSRQRGPRNLRNLANP